MNDTAIDIRGVSVKYESKLVLNKINMLLPQGHSIGIVGPNGAGKSTLLKAIMGFIPFSGRVLIFKKSLKEVRHQIAYVPQKDQIDWNFPATVFDVVLMGLYKELGIFGRVRNTHREKVMLFLEKVGMQQEYKKQISELSGGQQQRVFLARALAQEANLYILDEPFTGIDAATEELLIQIFKKIIAEGKTMIAVHHQLASVSSYFDWLVMLSNGEIVANGKTSEVFTETYLQQTYQKKTSFFTQSL